MATDKDIWNVFKKFLVKEKDFKEVPIGKPEPCVIGTDLDDANKQLKAFTAASQMATQSMKAFQQNLPFPPPSPHICSGVVSWEEILGKTPPKDATKERNIKMGNRVLRNVEAHETERLGELAILIHEKLT